MYFEKPPTPQTARPCVPAGARDRRVGLRGVLAGCGTRRLPQHLPQRLRFQKRARCLASWPLTLQPRKLQEPAGQRRPSPGASRPPPRWSSARWPSALRALGRRPRPRAQRGQRGQREPAGRRTLPGPDPGGLTCVLPPARPLQPFNLPTIAILTASGF